MSEGPQRVSGSPPSAQRDAATSVAGCAGEPAAVRASEIALATFRRLGPAGPLAVISATLPALGGFALLVTLNPVGEWLRGHELAGWFLYIAGFWLAGGLALLPTNAQAVLGGWAFGVAGGLPAALVGFLGASAIGYATGRWASGERVVGIISEHPRWRAVYDELLRSGPWKTLLIVVLVRLPPNSPFALTNLVLSATRVPPVLYLAGTLIGMAPRAAVAVYIASTLQTLSFDEIQRPWLLVAGIVVTLAVLAVLGVMANRAIARVTGAGANVGGTLRGGKSSH